MSWSHCLLPTSAGQRFPKSRSIRTRGGEGDAEGGG